MPSNWSTQSFVNNYGYCHLCGASYKEGWLDEMANETCDSCKNVQEAFEADITDDDVLMLLVNQEFSQFEVNFERE